jgi:hypothetical protein
VALQGPLQGLAAFRYFILLQHREAAVVFRFFQQLTIGVRIAPGVGGFVDCPPIRPKFA